MKTVYLIECDDWGSTFSSVTATDVAFTTQKLAEEFLANNRMGFEARIKPVFVFNSTSNAKEHVWKPTERYYK